MAFPAKPPKQSSFGYFLIVIVSVNTPRSEQSHAAKHGLGGHWAEPRSEAMAWHSLGRLLERARQWEEAERHYREAARIHEERNDLAAAARTWHQLGVVNANVAKPDASELWYRKAIERFRSVADQISAAECLSNLADLLRNQPGRLAEARQLAKEALAIKRTLDPGAVAICNTCNILAQVTEQEAQAVTTDPRKAELQTQACEFVAKHQAMMRQRGPGGTAVAAVLDRILAGERDETALCECFASIRAADHQCHSCRPGRPVHTVGPAAARGVRAILTSGTVVWRLPLRMSFCTLQRPGHQNGHQSSSEK